MHGTLLLTGAGLIYFARRHHFALVERPFCRAPQSVQSGKHVAALDSEAANREAVRGERTDSPKGFAGPRVWFGGFTKLLFERHPLRCRKPHTTNIKRRPVA